MDLRGLITKDMIRESFDEAMAMSPGRPLHDCTECHDCRGRSECEEHYPNPTDDDIFRGHFKEQLIQRIETAFARAIGTAELAKTA